MCLIKVRANVDYESFFFTFYTVLNHAQRLIVKRQTCETVWLDRFDEYSNLLDVMLAIVSQNKTEINVSTWTGGILKTCNVLQCRWLFKTFIFFLQSQKLSSRLSIFLKFGFVLIYVYCSVQKSPNSTHCIVLLLLLRPLRSKSNVRHGMKEEWEGERERKTLSNYYFSVCIYKSIRLSKVPWPGIEWRSLKVQWLETGE